MAELDELASAALDDRLTADEQAQLDASPEALALQAAFSRDRAALKALPRVKAPPEMAARVGLRARRERFNSWVRRGLGLAACLVLAFWALSFFRPHRGLPLDQLGPLTGTFRGGPTHLSLSLDAGATPGVQPIIRVSFDFNGDGKWDYAQVSAPIVLDGREGWERIEVEVSSGEMRDFTGGRVHVELLNGAGVKLDGAGSRIVLPYKLHA